MYQRKVCAKKAETLVNVDTSAYAAARSRKNAKNRIGDLENRVKKLEEFIEKIFGEDFQYK